MKNPAPYIREQLTVLLNETITYDSVDVPCYEGEGEVTPYQIIIAEQTSTDNSYRDQFNGDFEQVIEVVSEQKTNVRKHVDSIGGQVMNIIKPTPKTHGLADSADFQIAVVRVVSQSYLDENSGDGTVINRLILRYRFFIVQK